MRKLLKSIFILFCLLPVLAACGPGRGEPAGGEREESGEDQHLFYARLFTLEDGDGYTVATIMNPWDSKTPLGTYILVPDSTEIPGNLPKGSIVRTPLKNALVFTAVHSGLLHELGATDAIGAVCSSDYINVPEIHNRIADGRITDCGNDASPDIERVISARPDAMLMSPYENNPSNSRIESMGAPLIMCADYMEATPLARAEWVKLFGMLFGREEEAEAMFADTEREYLALKEAAAQTSSRPKAIFDGVYGNQWYVPRRDATLATYIRDSGAVNPFDHYDGTGSVAMSPEKVLVEAGDADYWLVRYAAATDLTLPEFVSQQPVYKEFAAAKSGKVYGCNTIGVPYFEETPFHPQWFLGQLVAIFHPELGLNPSHIYFKQL